MVHSAPLSPPLLSNNSLTDLHPLPSLCFTGDTTSGLYLDTTGTTGVAVSAGGVKKFKVGSTSGGTVQAFEPIYMSDGTSAAPALIFTNDNQNGFYRDTTHSGSINGSLAHMFNSIETM